jgi:formate hydrogenlyase subunit 3/multisubunit Na+/H+ antiporter MnhD subunit
MEVLLIGLALQVLGGLAALTCSRMPRAATVFGAGSAVLCCLIGLIPTLHVLLDPSLQPLQLSVAWDDVHGKNFAVAVDSLSAFFLLPILGLSVLAAVYGANYLLAYRHEKSLGAPWFFFNIFVAAMALVVIARTAFLFLVAWEAMSIAAWCLVTFEHEKAEVRRAGWIYLIATHLGVAFLIAAFVLLGRQAGSLEFAAFGSMPAFGAITSGVVFVLALVGFGGKAGLVPFHVWLPEAHPAAPSHVSALMSAVMIKMGIYGMLRIMTFLGPPALWWGPTLAALGLLTGIVGISLALSQGDIKRVLAYSSVENMGLIVLALGVALWGRANGQPVVAALAMAGALLHIWNHALMKGLMFFTAGSVLHGTGTRDMEQLGGLMKRMPRTGMAMMVGAVAMAALPPLNGFVGKWLMYLSLLKSGMAATNIHGPAALLTIGVLALIGGLSAITFVRLTGIVLLGSPRTEAAAHGHESSSWMIGPMRVLVVLCLAVAVVPQLIVATMSGTLDQVLGQDTGQTLATLEASEVPVYIVGNINAWALIAIGLTAAALLALTRRPPTAERPTWGCGYVQPTPRIQYTGRSFAEILVGTLLPRFLRPRTLRNGPEGLFPSKSEFTADSPDPVSDKVYEPLFACWAARFVRLRILQQGKVHIYLVYIMLTVVLALAWVSLRT